MPQSLPKTPRPGWQARRLPCCAATQYSPADDNAGTAVAPLNVRGFRRLRALAGAWRGHSSDGKEIYLTYEVTGKQSAVIERYRHFFKGKMMEDEMLTMYHLDGEDLTLTHYCTLGNQPRMRARIDDVAVPQSIRFEYVGASNLPHPDALRMCGVTFEFLDDDHFRQTWYWDGKKCYIKPENRSDDYDDIPDDGLGFDTFTLVRVQQEGEAAAKKETVSIG
jgi:hypothetical protein